jgi:hypothetical protein
MLSDFEVLRAADQMMQEFGCMPSSKQPNTPI